MKLNVLCGMPRSGSTLLQNLLNQNPRFHCSSTSPLLPTLLNGQKALVGTDEFKGMLGRSREKATETVQTMLAYAAAGWYADREEEVVFDKCRGWGACVPFLRGVFPEAKVVVVVRNPLAIVASMERRAREAAVITPEASLTMQERFGAQITNGLLSGAMKATMDAVHRKLPDDQGPVFFVKYEHLANDPEATMKLLYAYLEEKHYDHDFRDVQSTATDPDHLYWFLFPHDGSGPVAKDDPNGWRGVFDAEFANMVLRNPTIRQYCEAFGYQTEVPSETVVGGNGARPPGKNRIIKAPPFGKRGRKKAAKE